MDARNSFLQSDKVSIQSLNNRLFIYPLACTVKDIEEELTAKKSQFAPMYDFTIITKRLPANVVIELYFHDMTKDDDECIIKKFSALFPGIKVDILALQGKITPEQLRNVKMLKFNETTLRVTSDQILLKKLRDNYVNRHRQYVSTSDSRKVRISSPLIKKMSFLIKKGSLHIKTAENCNEAIVTLLSQLLDEFKKTGLPLDNNVNNTNQNKPIETIPTVVTTAAPIARQESTRPAPETLAVITPERLALILKNLKMSPINSEAMRIVSNETSGEILYRIFISNLSKNLNGPKKASVSARPFSSLLKYDNITANSIEVSIKPPYTDKIATVMLQLLKDYVTELPLESNQNQTPTANEFVPSDTTEANGAIENNQHLHPLNDPLTRANAGERPPELLFGSFYSRTLLKEEGKDIVIAISGGEMQPVVALLKETIHLHHLKNYIRILESDEHTCFFEFLNPEETLQLTTQTLKAIFIMLICGEEDKILRLQLEIINNLHRKNGFPIAVQRVNVIEMPNNQLVLSSNDAEVFSQMLSEIKSVMQVFPIDREMVWDILEGHVVLSPLQQEQASLLADRFRFCFPTARIITYLGQFPDFPNINFFSEKTSMLLNDPKVVISWEGVCGMAAIFSGLVDHYYLQDYLQVSPIDIQSFELSLKSPLATSQILKTPLNEIFRMIAAGDAQALDQLHLSIVQNRNVLYQQNLRDFQAFDDGRICAQVMGGAIQGMPPGTTLFVSKRIPLNAGDAPAAKQRRTQ